MVKVSGESAFRIYMQVVPQTHRLRRWRYQVPLKLSNTTHCHMVQKPQNSIDIKSVSPWKLKISYKKCPEHTDWINNAWCAPSLLRRKGCEECQYRQCWISWTKNGMSKWKVCESKASWRCNFCMSGLFHALKPVVTDIFKAIYWLQDTCAPPPHTHTHISHVLYNYM